VADLEQLAVKRDRGYLLRLVLLLLLGLGASAVVLKALTGDGVTGCVANTFLGQDAAPAAPSAGSPAPATR
jgi:hypothetical protein